MKVFNQKSAIAHQQLQHSALVLAYQHDGGGFKVYSVGANRKDDGGIWEQHSDLQTMRRGNPLDIGMPSPDR